MFNRDEQNEYDQMAQINSNHPDAIYAQEYMQNYAEQQNQWQEQSNTSEKY